MVCGDKSDKSDGSDKSDAPPSPGLNPCFNGVWSARLTLPSVLLLCLVCLNPCFNGIRSASSEVICSAVSQQQVLILVLME